jgi:hypothetical protein
MRTVFQATVLVVLATVGGTACATSRAETVRESPALDVPIPPPREITPLPAPQPPQPRPVEDLPGASVNTPVRPRPQRERETPPVKPAEQKPEETKPAEPPPTVTPPVPQLRIPETGNTAQSESQIRAIVERTRAILDKIDYQTLSDEGKKAYGDAKQFATQADEKLKVNNLVFAKELADKAERLAKELQGR